MYKNIEDVIATRREKQARRQHAPAEPPQRRIIRGESVAVRPVPELDRYMFDLQGFIVIRGAVSAEELERINAFHDATVPPGEEFGLSAQEAQAMMADPDSHEGKELQ